MKFNLVTHLCWSIAVLLSIISFLLLHVTDGNEINSYISFAASLASLILAVVAIFYAMVSNQSFSATIGVLQKSAENVQISSSDIDKTLTEFLEEISSIKNSIDQVPSSVTKLSADLKTHFDTLNSSNEARPSNTVDGEISNDNEPVKLSKNQFILGVSVALYVIGMGNKANKQIDTESMGIDDTYATGLIVGVLYMFNILAPYGADVKAVGANFYVASLGRIDRNDLVTILDGEDSKIVASLKRSIDEYFSSPTAEDNNEDDLPS